MKSNKLLTAGLAVLCTCAINLSAFGLSIPTETTNICLPTTLNTQNTITTNLNSYVLLNNSALTQSIALLNIAQTLETMGEVDSDYIYLMLELSNDIGTMADRILLMADNILIMADNIDAMADKILTTQELQSANLAITQSNLLESQRILNGLLN